MKNINKVIEKELKLKSHIDINCPCIILTGDNMYCKNSIMDYMQTYNCGEIHDIVVLVSNCDGLLSKIYRFISTNYMDGPDTPQFLKSMYVILASGYDTNHTVIAQYPENSLCNSELIIMTEILIEFINLGNKLIIFTNNLLFCEIINNYVKLSILKDMIHDFKCTHYDMNISNNLNINSFKYYDIGFDGIKEHNIDSHGNYFKSICKPIEKIKAVSNDLNDMLYTEYYNNNTEYYNNSKKRI